MESVLDSLHGSLLVIVWQVDQALRTDIRPNFPTASRGHVAHGTVKVGVRERKNIGRKKRRLGWVGQIHCEYGGVCITGEGAGWEKSSRE